MSHKYKLKYNFSDVESGLFSKEDIDPENQGATVQAHFGTTKEYVKYMESAVRVITDKLGEGKDV